MSTITRSSAKAKRARSINSGDIEMPTNMCQVCTIEEISRETLKILYKLCQFTFEHYIQSGPWQIYGKHLTDSGRKMRREKSICRLTSSAARDGRFLLIIRHMIAPQSFPARSIENTHHEKTDNTAPSLLQIVLHPSGQCQ